MRAPVGKGGLVVSALRLFITSKLLTKPFLTYGSPY